MGTYRMPVAESERTHVGVADNRPAGRGRRACTRKAGVRVVLSCALLAALAFGQWEPDRRLTSDPDSSTTYGLCVGGGWSVAVAGTDVVAVWTDQRDGVREVYCKHSADGGAIWGPDTRLSADDGRSSRYPSVAARDRDFHVVWEDYGEVYYRRSTDGGATWEPVVNLTNESHAQQIPSLAVSGDNVHVVWYDNRETGVEIWYMRSTDNGATWSDAVRVTIWDGVHSWFPSVAADGDYVHVVWDDWQGSNGHGVFYSRSTDNGLTWSSEVELVTRTNFGTPNIAAAGGAVHVVWRDLREGHDEVIYRRSSDNGATWEPDFRMSDTLRISTYASVAARGSDVHVVWQNRFPPAGNYEICWKGSQDRGASWRGKTVRTTYDDSVSVHPSVAMTGDTIHVVWQDSRDGNTEIYHKRNLTGLTPPLLVLPPDTSIDQPVTGELVWGQVGMASGYDVYLDTIDPPETRVSENQADSIFSFSLPNGPDTYYWRVDARTAGAIVQSAVWSFTTMAAPEPPVLSWPPNGAVERPVNGSLLWNAAARATGYDVYLDTVTPPVNQVSVNQPGTAYVYSDLEYGRAYYWQIVSRNDGGTAGSDVWSFSTGSSGLSTEDSELNVPGFEVFPDPVSGGRATVRYSLSDAGPLSLTVFDASGRAVARQTAAAMKTGQVGLDLRRVAAGVYFVRLEAGEYSQTQALVVQK